MTEASTGVQEDHGLRCVHGGNLDLGLLGVNIVVGGAVTSALEGHQVLSLQQQNGARLVHGVVRDGNGTVLGNFGYLLVLLREESHGVNIGRTDNLQVFTRVHVVARQVCDVLEAVQVGIARFHGGVGLVVVGEFLVFDVDTLLGGFFLEHVVSFSVPTTPMVTFLYLLPLQEEGEPQAARLKTRGTTASAATNFFTAMKLSVE